jgi:hypothetical protein
MEAGLDLVGADLEDDEWVKGMAVGDREVGDGVLIVI